MAGRKADNLTKERRVEAVYRLIQGLEDFCAAHGLTRSLMDKVYSGERRSHKGWTVQRG